jgi:hypothetical protein
VYCGLFSLFVILGRRFFPDGIRVMQRPLQLIGAGGILFLSVVMSFSDPWQGLHSMHRDHAYSNLWTEPILVPAVAAITLLALVMLLPWRANLRHYLWGVSAALMAMSYGLVVGGTAPWIAALVFNIYLLALGVQQLTIGLRSHNLGTLNGGMLILSLLIVCRFFDSEIDLLVRGLAFIALGIGFLSTNLIVARRSRHAAGRA